MAKETATARVPPGAIRAAADLAPYIDHTLLKADATPEQIGRLCGEAREYGFAGVCVNGAHVGVAARLLGGARNKVIAVVAFPLGAMSAAAKAYEAWEAVRSGASEIDMVLNLGLLKCGQIGEVEDEIRRVVEAAAPAKVKVILETGLLGREEKVAACGAAKAGGAAFVKTSTGFGPGGATVEDVALLRQTVGDELGVKASGGVRSAADALRMIEAGANRLGTSAGVAIVTGALAEAERY
jgi:deoxyribose-phosphate aldolase